MSYWKAKVLPQIKKYFDKPGKKKAAAEACKSFEDSKASIEIELEEKKEELKLKIIEVYKPLDAQTKAIVKQPTDAAIKKHASAVKKLLEQLSKIGFPGAAPASEAAVKYGPALVVGPVTYVFQKTSMFIIDLVEEEAPPVPEVAAEPKIEEVAAEPTIEEPAAETKEAEGEAAAEVAAQAKEGGGAAEAAAEEATAEQKGAEGVVSEKVEKQEDRTTDDGKIVETVTVPTPEPAKA